METSLYTHKRFLMTGDRKLFKSSSYIVCCHIYNRSKIMFSILKQPSVFFSGYEIPEKMKRRKNQYPGFTGFCLWSYCTVSHGQSLGQEYKNRRLGHVEEEVGPSYDPSSRSSVLKILPPHNSAKHWWHMCLKESFSNLSISLLSLFSSEFAIIIYSCSDSILLTVDNLSIPLSKQSLSH